MSGQKAMNVRTMVGKIVGGDLLEGVSTIFYCSLHKDYTAVLSV